MYAPQIIYEDNHIIAVNKQPSELVQGDRTGDTSLNENLKLWLKNKYNKPGNVFLGVVHRLDRPVSGVVVFAKTSKSLSRMNNLFKEGDVKKTYWAIVGSRPGKDSDTLIHQLKKNPSRNKSYVYDKPVKGSKEAILSYKTLYIFKSYTLLEIDLHTGRHHQIRCQLAKIGSPVLGDLKYGFPRSIDNGGIGLHSRELSFIHPVSRERIVIRADPSGHVLWEEFLKNNKKCTDFI
ncbi:MAG: RNA pseudouridine synthase [Bacteroidales bacterium]